jgi:hypothetical protein
MDEMEEMRMKDLMNIEDQIRDLERSPEVRLARQYEQIREKRLAYLQELKQQARFGQRLHDMGWAYTPEVGYAETE